MKKAILLIMLLVFITACQSTKKYNERATKTHSVEELREDVDFLFKRLKKNHPHLYDYISEEELDFKIDSFKQNLQPMNSMAFFHQLYPLISEIKQGHLGIRPAFVKRDRKERKRYRKANVEFSDIDFKWIENEVYVEDTYDKLDTLLVGSKVLAVDSIPVKDLMHTWKKRITSDGFNQTFQSPIIADRLFRFYIYEVGRVDSIDLHLQKADSVFVKKLKIVFKDKEIKEEKQDTLAEKKDSIQKEPVKKKKLTRAEKKQKRKENKEKRRSHYKRGYNEKTKISTRNFYRVGKDSTVAYLKIRGFEGGKWTKKFYDEVFAELDSTKAEHLIIDLRDNTGGALSEIGYLYSYLAKEDFLFIEPMEVTRGLSGTRAFWSGKPTLIGNFFKFILTPITMGFDLFDTKRKDGKVYTKSKYSKVQEPKPNAFKGKVYVLINGMSFSASSILSTNLHGSQRATFIGEETGGAYNGTVAGTYQTTYLRNTELMVPVWTKFIEAPYKDEPNGYGIKPDIQVEPTVEDFLTGKDTVLERALQEIEGE